MPSIHSIHIVRPGHKLGPPLIVDSAERIVELAKAVAESSSSPGKEVVAVRREMGSREAHVVARFFS